ncbi:uncharacterized protein BO97DRAFT_81244 [Aspergillus homomorphus CBS 101889]|uniref:Uncharacterized protein n=1 Tax=Aspergillus homomorphus (strain CBS 101889) TaxID=1450537 RepID=A0A395IFP3_ASPHC|nr:hypothetical protein BO97DRAFT_81244 [Aspergillus homomorphus CBS 101889]RAL17004.1 hypothetical protein BO97DRAFT_81244 [Aspergillus homomorphus CBS 101889]
MSGMEGGSQWSGESTGKYQTGSQNVWEGESSSSSGSTSQAWSNASPAESTIASATTPTAADSFLTATRTTFPSSTASTNPSSTSTSSANSSNSNTTKTLAIAIPVAVVGAAIIFGLLFFFLRRRRRRRRGHAIPSTSQVDVVTVPRQPILPKPRNSPRSQPPQGTPWGFTANDTHSIPFTGPIPYSSSNLSGDLLAPNQSRSLDTAASHQNSPAGIDTPLEQPPPYTTQPGRAETSVSPVIDTGAPSRHGSRRERPTSPFNHPLDDAVSDISRYSRGPSLVHRASLDDISSVSSMGDDERQPAMRH